MNVVIKNNDRVYVIYAKNVVHYPVWGIAKVKGASLDMATMDLKYTVVPDFGEDSDPVIVDKSSVYPSKKLFLAALTEYTKDLPDQEQFLARVKEAIEEADNNGKE